MLPPTLPPSFAIRDEVAALKRARITDVAIALFHQRGYVNTTLDMIAEQMSVTKPFIYAHFSSKSSLLAEICSTGVRSALAAIEGDAAHPARERLLRVAGSFVEFSLANSHQLAIFTREVKNLGQADLTRLRAMRREFDQRLTQLLDDGVASGEFNVPDTRVAALAICGMVSWSYVWYRADGRLSPGQIGDVLTQLILNLAGAEPLRAPPAGGTAIAAARGGAPGGRDAAPIAGVT